MQRGYSSKFDELLYAGTIGQGVQRSRDGGEHWEAINYGLPPQCDVRALVAHPQHHTLLFAGTDHGCFRSQDSGLSWKSIRSIDESHRGVESVHLSRRSRPDVCRHTPSAGVWQP